MHGLAINKNYVNNYAYFGEWKNDKMSGQGTIKYVTGESYTGGVRNN